MEYYAKTDIGKKYDHNEDFYVLPEANEKYGIKNIDVKNKGMLFILCDGMGGGNAGEVVSELTASWIMKEYYANEEMADNPKEKLKEIINSVNERIKKLSKEHEVYKGWGTTLVATLIIKNTAYVLSVGDSRLYLYGNKELIQITEDQSEVWEIYKKGIITKEEMRKHPHKHILNTVIGMEGELKINEYELNLEKDNILLMCSDGLTDMLTDKEIAERINRRSLKKTAEKLVKQANRTGGRDNITVILIKI